VIAKLQGETQVLIEKHGGNAAISEIVEYLAAKVFAEGGGSLPRRPGTPSRATPILKSPVPEVEVSGHVMLTLSSEYTEESFL
jgi:hypothetical protein